MPELVATTGSAVLRFDGKTLRVFKKSVVGMRPSLELDATLVEGVRFDEPKGWSKGTLLLGLPDGSRDEYPFSKGESAAFREIYLELASRLVASRDAVTRAEAMVIGASGIPAVGDGTAGVGRHDGLRVVEVIRHFDMNTVGQIVGSLDMAFSLSGSTTSDWANMFTKDWRSSYSSSMSGVGRGAIQLTEASTTRADMVNEGFMAVMEIRDGATLDTLRVLVPPIQVVQQTVVAKLASLNKSSGRRRLNERDFGALASSLLGRLQWESSYVSDRLTAFARHDGGGGQVGVLGITTAPGVVLGGAIEFGGDRLWHQLVPFGLFQRLVAVPDRSRVAI